jgi:phage anti-repressor protein
MKKYFIVISFIILSVGNIFTQEKIKYGNIPYSMSVEEIIKIYGPLYDDIYQNDNLSITIDFLGFTAIRPYFKDIYGEVPGRSNNYYLDRRFTKELSLIEKNGRDNLYTTLYFLLNNNKTELFMVTRESHGGRYDNVQERHVSNRDTVSEILKLRPQNLQGNYEYYSSGYRTEEGYVSVWETNTERIILHIGKAGLISHGSYLYISKRFWNEYVKLYVQERNRKMNENREGARSSF